MQGLHVKENEAAPQLDATITDRDGTGVMIFKKIGHAYGWYDISVLCACYIFQETAVSGLRGYHDQY